MEENKNDQHNQQSDRKSNQESTEEFKKKETNPNNPTATQDKHPGTQQDNHQRQGSTTPEDRTNTDVQGNNKREKETTDGRTPGDFRTQNQENREGNQKLTEEFKKKETNPNNPIATPGKQQGSQQDNQQLQDSTSPQGKTNTDVQGNDKGEKETTDGRTPEDFRSQNEENRKKNQNTQK